MSKISSLWGPLDEQLGKSSEKLLESPSQHLYHIHWFLPRKLSWKKSLLLTCKILGLIFNTLAADDRYPIPNKDNLTIPTQMQLSERQQTSSQFLAAFLISSGNLKPFEKKMTTLDYLFPNLRDPKMWLDKSLQRPVSQDPWTSNMVNVSKHCWNLHHSTFINSLISVKAVELENISLIDMSNFGTAC